MTTNNNGHRLSRFDDLLDGIVTYTVIWLSVNQRHENDVGIVENLQNNFSHFKKFDNYNLCEKYIDNRKINEQIILIVTDRQYISRLHDKSSIITICIYDSSKTDHELNEEDTQQYPKVCIDLLIHTQESICIKTIFPLNACLEL